MRIRGLPFTCKEQDIMNLFSAYGIMEENGVVLAVHKHGPRAGIERYIKWFLDVHFADNFT